MEISGVDYSKVEGLQRRRVVTFVNHFIIQTSSFMTKFSHTCDIKLLALSKKLQRLETSLALLESKLASVPDLRAIGLQYPHLPVKPDESSANNSIRVEEPIIGDLPKLCTDIPNIETEPPAPMDPRMAKFAKMISVGVPEQAVRLKIRAEGLDDAILDKILAKH
jgi:WASH complex subunit CCDC53